jgi:hypothetical protein
MIRQLKLGDKDKSVDRLGMEGIFQSTKDWQKVVLSEYFNSNEFLYFLEDTFQSEIIDASQIKELTGLADEIFNNFTKRFGPGMLTFESIIISRSYRNYIQSIKNAMNSGKKYVDILKILPEDYGLPEEWIGMRWSDSRDNQYTSILSSIDFEQYIEDSYIVFPDIKRIAIQLEAPIDLIIEAAKFHDIDVIIMPTDPEQMRYL